MDTNFVFLPFKNKHKGQTSIIFATGPTASEYIPIEEHDKAIKVGVNNIGAMINFELDFLKNGTLPIVKIKSFAACLVMEE